VPTASSSSFQWKPEAARKAAFRSGTGSWPTSAPHASATDPPDARIGNGAAEAVSLLLKKILCVGHRFKTSTTTGSACCCTAGLPGIIKSDATTRSSATVGCVEPLFTTS
jgi:hypothetical protein